LNKQNSITGVIEWHPVPYLGQLAGAQKNSLLKTSSHLACRPEVLTSGAPAFSLLT